MVGDTLCSGAEHPFPVAYQLCPGCSVVVHSDGEEGLDGSDPAFWELDGEFPGKTPAAQRRTRASALMDLALEWLLDGRRHAARVPLEDLAHGGVLDQLTEISAGELESCMDCLLQARQDVSLNLSPEILTERVLRALADLSGRSSAATRRP